MVLCGRLDGVASAAPSSAGKIHTHASFSKHKKCPYSPVWGARTGKTNILRYHLACRFRGHLCRCKHTAGPVTLAMRQKILGKKPFPPALSGPFAAPLFTPFPATGALCGCAHDVISASTVYNGISLSVLNNTFARLSSPFLKNCGPG